MGTVTRRSFTLIEIIIAVGVIGLIIPTVFNIFFTMVRQQLVLIAFQEMKQQGDSVQRNMKNVLQNRAAYVTDSAYTATDVCPLITTPTPTYSPEIYIRDREGNRIHIYSPSVGAIASSSADINNAINTYNLTSGSVVVSNIGFTCYRINEFVPVTVSTQFTVTKSTMFKDLSLPYSFNVRFRNY